MTINRFNIFNTITSLHIVEHAPYFCGETINFNAQVSNANIGEEVPNGGIIQLFDTVSQTVLASETLPSTGTFAGTITLGGGLFSIVAQYLGTNGSTVFNPSSSSAISISTPAITTSTSITSLQSTANCSTTSIPITVDVAATISGATNPSVGTITVYGTQSGNTIPLVSGIPVDGIATMNIPASSFPNFGSWSIEAIYSGFACYSSSTSPSSTLQLVLDPTTTSIVAVSSSTLCESSPLTVTVSVSPTSLQPPSSGIVTLYGTSFGNTVTLGSATPVNGTATITVPAGTFTSVGLWYLQAQYLAGTCYASSSSPGGVSGYAVTIFNYANNSTSTSLVVPSAGSTSFTNQAVTVIASISALYSAVTSGSVSFYGGYNYASLSPIVSANVSGGTATASIPASNFTSTGTYYLQAVYGGTQCCGSSSTPSGSSALEITIIQAGTITSITSAIPSTIYCNNPNIAVTVQVSSALYAPPSVGTVTLYAFQGSDYIHGTSFVLGTVTPTNGIANMTIVTSSFADQAYNQPYYIQAVYTGSGSYPSSSSVGNPGAPSLRVVLDNTTTSIASVSSSLFCSSSTISVTANVSANVLSAPSIGTVSFYATNGVDPQIYLGSATPSNGSATISVPGSSFTEMGGWNIVASYSAGNLCYNSSSSTASSVGYITVYNYTSNSTATTLTSPSRNSSYFVGNSVHVSAYVSSTYGSPSGAVSFYGGYNANSPSLLGSANISGSGSASMDIPASYFTTPGEFFIQAVYNGNQCFGSSNTPGSTNALPIFIIEAGTVTTMSTIPQAVYCNNSNVGVTVNVTSSAFAPPSVGTVTLTATLGGTVETLGSATPVNGVANLTLLISTFSSFAGLNTSWQIQASYTGGGTQYPNSASATQPMEILGDTTTTTISSVSNSNICLHGGVTITVNVTGTNLPAPSVGTVTLYATNTGGQVTLGTATPTNGVASILVGGLTFGALGGWYLEATYSNGNTCYFPSNSPTGSSGYLVTVYDHTTNISSTTLQYPATTPAGNPVSITANVSTVYGLASSTAVLFYGGYNFSHNLLGSATITNITDETGFASITIPGSTVNQHGAPFYMEAYINGSVCLASSTTGFGTGGPNMTTT